MGAVAISMIALGVLMLVWVYRDIPPAESTDDNPPAAGDFPGAAPIRSA